MARPKTRFDLQPPALRPVASPVDTFFQPQPPIPAEVVSSGWMQLAKSMASLSPGIAKILEAQEKRTKKELPEEAKGFVRAWYEPTEKEIRAAFKENSKETKKWDAWVRQREPAEAGEFERYDPPFDLKVEREKLIAARASQAKLFSGMPRKEAAEWLKNAQEAIGDRVVLDNAARPDFQLNLQELMGGGWSQRTKRFLNSKNEPDTFASALGSRLREWANAPDFDAWLREFEAPLREGFDSEKSQGFLLGAVEALASHREQLKARALQMRLMNDAANANKEMVDQGVELSNGWFHLGNSFFYNPEPIPVPMAQADKLVIQQRNTKKRKAAEASKQAFADYWNKISLNPSIDPKERLSILSTVTKHIAENYFADDPTGGLTDEFLSMVRNIPQGKSGTPLGQVPYWRRQIRQIEVDIDKIRKREAPRGDYTKALRSATDAVLQVAGQENKTEELNNMGQGELAALFAQPAYANVINEALIEELGEEYAENRSYLAPRDIAERFARDRRDRLTEPTAAQIETKKKLRKMLNEQGNNTAFRNALDAANLPLGDTSGLIKLAQEKEHRSRTSLGYTELFEGLSEDLWQGLSEKTLNRASLSQMGMLIDKTLTKARSEWAAASDKEREKLAPLLRQKYGEALHKGKEWQKLLESSVLKDRRTVFKEILEPTPWWKDVTAELFSYIPLRDQLRDARGNLLFLDEDRNRPAMGEPKEALTNRRLALGRMREQIIQRIKDKGVLAKLKPGDVGNWHPHLIKMLGLEGKTLTDLINQALEPRRKVSAKQPTAPGVAEGEKEFAARQSQMRGMRGSPVQYIRNAEGKIEKVDTPLSSGELDRIITNSSHRTLLSTNPKKGSDSWGVTLYKASRELPISQGTKAIVEDLYTSRDQAVADSVAISPSGLNVLAWSRKTFKVTDNPNYPTSNEASIWWLSSLIHGIAPQNDDAWYQRQGDWFMEMGVEIGQFAHGTAMKKLASHKLEEGFWPEEIITGMTRQGIPLADLGWKTASDIPWQITLFGRRDPKIYQKDLDAFWDKKNKRPRDGWEKTLMGRALIKMDISPTSVIPGAFKGDGSPLTMVDHFFSYQNPIRQFHQQARGKEFARSDRYSHNIRRLDSNAKLGEQYLSMARSATGMGEPFFARAREPGRLPSPWEDGTDWRIFNHRYANMNERTRAIEKEFNEIRGGK